MQKTMSTVEMNKMNNSFSISSSRLPKKYTEDKFPICISNRKAYVWDIDHVLDLKMQTSTIFKLAQQNVFLGLPLELMPEEVFSPAKSGIAIFIDEKQAHCAPTLEEASLFKAKEDTRIANDIRILTLREAERQVAMKDQYCSEIELTETPNIPKETPTQTVPQSPSPVPIPNTPLPQNENQSTCPKIYYLRQPETVVRMTIVLITNSFIAIPLIQSTSLVHQPWRWLGTATLSSLTPMNRGINLDGNQESMKAHFNQQVKIYGDQYLVNLVNSSGYGKPVKDYYEQGALQLDPQCAFAAHGLAIALEEHALGPGGPAAYNTNPISSASESSVLRVKNLCDSIAILNKVREALNDGRVYVNLGHCHYLRDKFERSIENTASRRFCKGKNAQVLLYLARAWYQKASKDKSFHSLRNALNCAQEQKSLELLLDLPPPRRTLADIKLAIEDTQTAQKQNSDAESDVDYAKKKKRNSSVKRKNKETGIMIVPNGKGKGTSEGEEKKQKPKRIKKQKERGEDQLTHYNQGGIAGEDENYDSDDGPVRNNKEKPGKVYVSIAISATTI
ncbi:hypothetical protein BY996DRAFT_8683817 [Phakopsora pachyrhizi]|nr:hypothetical protein BY996DRAFT_8683817 [Phakopsora pachyrhizi]